MNASLLTAAALFSGVAGATALYLAAPQQRRWAAGPTARRRLLAAGAGLNLVALLLWLPVVGGLPALCTALAVQMAAWIALPYAEALPRLRPERRQ